MITIFVTLVIIGFCMYLVETYVPMAAPFRMIIRVVVALLVVLWLLQLFGIYDIPVRRVR